MKIIVICGSPRQHGNTEQVIAMLLEEMAGLAAQDGILFDYEIMHLAALDIKTCRGCRICFDVGEGKCPLKDDLPATHQKLLAADGILAASPVYVEDISGLMKNWMDRLAFLCHRPALAGKSFYAINTTGSMASAHAMQTLTRGISLWGCQLAGQGSYTMGGLMKPADTRARFATAIKKDATRFYTHLKQRQYENPTAMSLIMFTTQQASWRKTKTESLDLRHWREQGWLEKGVTFYAPHRAGFFKVGVCRLVGKIISLFVT